MRKLIVKNVGSDTEEFEFEGQAMSLAPGEAVEIGDEPHAGQVVREVAPEPAVPGSPHAAKKGGFL